eukprot:scaffold10506_cov93-Skeletonema_dohrnii-CCMP3373.AAC.2
MSYDTYVTRYSSYAYIVEQQKIAPYSSAADCIDDLHNKSHLFGGGLSGHAQSTVAHGGGSRSEGGGRADEEGGNSELHVDSLFQCRNVRSTVCSLAAMEHNQSTDVQG